MIDVRMAGNEFVQGTSYMPDHKTQAMPSMMHVQIARSCQTESAVCIFIGTEHVCYSQMHTPFDNQQLTAHGRTFRHYYFLNTVHVVDYEKEMLSEITHLNILTLKLTLWCATAFDG